MATRKEAAMNGTSKLALYIVQSERYVPNSKALSLSHTAGYRDMTGMHVLGPWSPALWFELLERSWPVRRYD